MYRPHAHHILFKEGHGPDQQALVEEGQALLRKHGIDPIYGKENLVWAPNAVKGQHHIDALREVVEGLRLADAENSGYNGMVKSLKKSGELAVERQK